MENRKQEKADGYSGTMGKPFRNCAPGECKERLDEVCQGRLTNPAQCKTCQGNAELRGGNVVVQVVQFILHHLRNAFAFGCKLIYTCLAHPHQSKLCCDEEAIDSHECKYRQHSYKSACFHFKCSFQISG